MDSRDISTMSVAIVCSEDPMLGTHRSMRPAADRSAPRFQLGAIFTIGRPGSKSDLISRIEGKVGAATLGLFQRVDGGERYWARF
jgi:hypothetical protein